MNPTRIIPLALLGVALVLRQRQVERAWLRRTDKLEREVGRAFKERDRQHGRLISELNDAFQSVVWRGRR